MEHFVTLERAIACPRASVAVAAETAAHVLTAAGYRRGLGFGPTASYVRAYRPIWVLVLAIALAIPTLGLSLFLLRVRRKDHCNVVIEDGPYGVVALVSGRVPAGLPAALEAASGQYVEQQYAGGHQQSPPPMLLSPSMGVEGAPSHTPQAILRPATPVPPMNAPGGPVEGGYPPPGSGGPGPGGPSYPAPSFDPYPLPQYGSSPRGGEVPDSARAGQRSEEQQPASPHDQPPPTPGPVRPPSKLAPPPVADEVGREPSGSSGGVNGTPPPASTSPPASSDDEPFASTSGRVPWVGGGRPGPLPAPPGPAPASPIRRPPGFPPPAPSVSSASSSSQSAPSSPSSPSSPPSPSPVAQPEPVPSEGRVATAVTDAPVLRVDTGGVLELGPFCLLGREPVAREGDPPPRLVRFDDPKLSVSKTHLAYGVDQEGVWVMDRNSTNGTTIIDPSGRRTPCAPGNRHYVGPGFHVQIGQRRISVEAPAHPDA